MSDLPADRVARPFMSLPGKVLLFVLVIGLLRVALVGGISIEFSNRIFGEVMGDLLEPAAEHSARLVDAALAASKAEIERLAGSDAVQRRIARGVRGAARQAFEAELELAIGGDASFVALFALNRSATAIAEVGPTPPLPDSSRRALAGVDAPSVSTLATEDGQLTVVASAPLRTRSGRRLATLHGVLSERSVAQLLPQTPTAVLGTGTVLISAGGAVLASDPLPLDIARERFPPDSIAQVGSGSIAVYPDGDGNEHLLTTRPLKHADWTLALSAHRDGGLRIALPLLLRVAAIEGVVLALFAAIAYLVSARLLRPIENLSRGAERISQGELDVAIPDAERQDEIGLLARTFRAMTEKLRQHRHEIESTQHQLVTRNQEMQRTNEILAQLSITDGLTKLHNHRYFQDHLTREIKRAERTGDPLAMLLADIDDFKKLNDRFGHAAGDELLVRIAQIMSETVRESDLLARYGGEEFVVLATATDLRGAIQLGEKIRTSVAETTFILDDSMRPTRVTVSIGVAAYENTRKAFFLEADRALYRAKADGKNCVMPPLPDE